MKKEIRKRILGDLNKEIFERIFEKKNCDGNSGETCEQIPEEIIWEISEGIYPGGVS